MYAFRYLNHKHIKKYSQRSHSYQKIEEVEHSIPPPVRHQIVKADPKEIDALFDSVPGSTAIKSKTVSVPFHEVYWTKKCFKHVFGMETQKNNDGIKYLTFNGFHFLGNYGEIDNEFYSYKFTTLRKNVAEGYIVVSAEHLPKYKTFFVFLERNEMIDKCIESLQAIEIINEKDHIWEFIGTSTDGIKVTTFVKKASKEIITFFPTSPKTPSQIKGEERVTRMSYRHLHFNPCYPAAEVQYEADFTALHRYAGGNEGIPVNLQLVRMDSTSIESMVYHKLYLGREWNPQMVHGLLTQSAIDFVLSETPWRQIEYINPLPKFYITIDTLKKVLEHRLERYPKYFNPYQIIDMLKESIQNYLQLIYETFQESV